MLWEWVCYKTLIRLVGRHSPSPFWCLCQKLSLSFFTLIKLCYTKALEWSSLVPDPKAKSSEITNLISFTVSYHSIMVWFSDPKCIWIKSIGFIQLEIKMEKNLKHKNTQVHIPCKPSKLWCMLYVKQLLENCFLWKSQKSK